MAENESFTFFYSTKSPFSQFHVAQFKATSLFEKGQVKGPRVFAHCEQWMMYNKAMLFNDPDTGAEIMASSADQKECKRLGRKVKNFDDVVWKRHRERIVYEGNKQKFTQNKHLLEQLLATRGTTLVEASPRDRVWGIGMGAGNPKAKSRATWRGANLLGQILTRLREELCSTNSTDQHSSGNSTVPAKVEVDESAVVPPKVKEVKDQGTESKVNKIVKKTKRSTPGNSEATDNAKKKQKF